MRLGLNPRLLADGELDVILEALVQVIVWPSGEHKELAVVIERAIRAEISRRERS